MIGRRASSRDEKRRAVRRSRYRRTTKPRDPLNRLVIVLIVFALIGAGYLAVLVDLQVVRPDRYRALGETQRTGVRALPAYRGHIVDRNGFVLASSTPGHQVVADPSQIADARATAALLAPYLGIEAGRLAELLEPESDNDHYELLTRSITDDVATRLEELKQDEEVSETLVGIYVQPEEERIYPGGDLAKPVIGRVDPDERGIYGVESQYDEAMTGIPGEEVFEKARFGSISVGDWKVKPGSAGYDVVLTIDYRVQHVVEQALIEHCAETGAEGATAVLTDPRTSEILAMASVERSVEGAGHGGSGGDCIIPGKNKALVDTFEPGSVLKPITIAAAAEELGFTADTMIEVPSSITVGGATFTDDPYHPGAPFPVSQIMANSMNVGTIKIAQQVGPGNVHRYQSRFGFGRLTGIGARGEEAGTVREPEEWQGADSASIPIGQGITVTAAQLAAAYNVLANGGLYQNLSLVRSLRSPEGVEYPRNLPPAKPVLSAKTAQTMADILVGVVENGTGKTAAIDGYTVAGKTGTAWKVFEYDGAFGYGSAGNRRYTATFAGFVPAYDPKLSMVVVVDEPQRGWSASAVAAPVFSEVALYALRILGVPPDTEPTSPDVRVRAEPAEVPEPASNVESAGPNDTIDGRRPASDLESAASVVRKAASQ